MTHGYSQQLAKDVDRFTGGLRVVGKAARMEPENLLSFFRYGYFVFEQAGFLYRRDSIYREVVPLTSPLRGELLPPDIRKSVENPFFRVSYNTAFKKAVHECSRPQMAARDRWLGQKLQDVLTRLHQQGHAHSAEMWVGDVLAASTIIVIAGNVPIGLTAFTRRDNRNCHGAGHAVVLELNENLRRAGFGWFDSIQPSAISRLQNGSLEEAATVNRMRDAQAARPPLAFCPQPAIFPPK